MDKSYIEHGQGADVKAARPENKNAQGKMAIKTKVDMASNKHEGVSDEPSHSGYRLDG